MEYRRGRTLGPIDVVPVGGQTTFSYTGAAQSFIVPMGVTSITVDISGGAGGNEYKPGNTISKGGRVECVLAVTPGESLQVNVGGVGGSASTNTSVGAGGWNGGGSGSYGAGGGGGASDIRQGGTMNVSLLLRNNSAYSNGGNDDSVVCQRPSRGCTVCLLSGGAPVTTFACGH